MGALATLLSGRSLLSQVLAREYRQAGHIGWASLINVDKQGLSHVITLEARRNSQSYTSPDPDSGPEALGLIRVKLGRVSL